MIRHVAFLVVISLALLLTLPARAEGPDRHFTPDELGTLCRHSVYLHGYLHGYEDGFHEADMDIHFGRAARPVKAFKQYRNGSGYQDSFGDRKLYTRGYQQGFSAAYADGMRGDPFRGFAQLRAAAAGYVPTASNLENKLTFDHALAEGYSAGYVQGETYDFVPASFEYAAKYCRNTGRGFSWCDAYDRGFQMGYNDAWTSRRNLQTARK